MTVDVCFAPASANSSSSSSISSMASPPMKKGKGHQQPAPSPGCNSPDRLYGQKATAEFCEHVVAELFSVASCSSSIRSGSSTPPSPSSSTKEPPPLVEFIAYALYRTRLPLPIVHQALCLLQRLKIRYPSAKGTSSSPHRLFLSSLMLSSKISMDDTYSNRSWAIVGGNYFALREVNQMERELFAFLEYNVVVSKEELADYVHVIEANWEMAQAARDVASYPSSPELPSGEFDHHRKRPRSETDATKLALQQEQALRHKRAADAAIALLRPTHGQAAQYKTSQKSRRQAFNASPTSSRSSSSSPSDDYRSHESSSGFSSAATSPTDSAQSSPTSSHGPLTPEILDACDRFEAVQAHEHDPQSDKWTSRCREPGSKAYSSGFIYSAGGRVSNSNEW